MEHLARAEKAGGPLSIYVHLPFCREMCRFCGCNVIATHDRTRADAYLDVLEKEVALVAAHLPTRRAVSQLHWGGGTPDLPRREAARARCHAILARHFQFLPRRRAGGRDRPGHHHQGADRPAGLARLQPHLHGRAGLRPQGPGDGGPHPGREGDRRPGRRGRARMRLPGRQPRPHLRPALPDAGDLDRHPRADRAHAARTGWRSSASPTCPGSKPHQKLLPQEALPKTEERVELFLSDGGGLHRGRLPAHRPRPLRAGDRRAGPGPDRRVPCSATSRATRSARPTTPSPSA